ncbi:MAG: hypothetical protein Q9190_001064 [Brigantiaea leucoxantha]
MANPRSHDPCAERGRLKDIEETSSGLPADAEKLYSALTDIQSNIFPQDLQFADTFAGGSEQCSINLQELFGRMPSLGYLIHDIGFQSISVRGYQASDLQSIKSRTSKVRSIKTGRSMDNGSQSETGPQNVPR